jgi:hypothetical protein
MAREGQRPSHAALFIWAPPQTPVADPSLQQIYYNGYVR